MKIEVCSHCRNKGDQEGTDTLREFMLHGEVLREKGIDFEIVESGCLGACRGPVARVKDRIYTELDNEKIETLMNSLAKEESR